LKDKIESKIQHIFKRITVLLKAKRQPDLHRGKSTDTTISADSVSLFNNEEDNNIENDNNIQINNDEYNREENDNNIQINQVRNNVETNNEQFIIENNIGSDDMRTETVDNISIEVEENEEQYKSEDDDYDQIENIVHEDYSGLRKLYYVIFKDGGYGWLDENQISDILLSNWNNKK